MISKGNAWRSAFEAFPPLLAQAQVCAPENLHVGLIHRAAHSTIPCAACGEAEREHQVAAPLRFNLIEKATSKTRR